MHYFLIALGIGINVASSFAAAKIAPKRGAKSDDWSFVALIIGPMAILWLYLFGGKNRRRLSVGRTK